MIRQDPEVQDLELQDVEVYDPSKFASEYGKEAEDCIGKIISNDKGGHLLYGILFV